MDNENKLLYTSDRGGHMEPIEIGKYLRKLRLENGFTQKDIAEKMHVTHQAVSSWENGKNIPDIDILTRLSEMYHITIDDIVMQNGKEDVETVEPRSGWKVFFSYVGIFFCVLGISLFLNYPYHIVSHVVFTFFFFMLITLYLVIFKLRNRKIEYLVITGLLVVIFGVIIINNFGYYNVNSIDGLVMSDSKDIQLQTPLGDETRVRMYTHVFDNYFLIYNENEENITVIPYNYYEEEVRTLETLGYPIKDLQVYNETIYFTSYDETINSDFKLNTIDFNTGDISVILETPEVYNLYHMIYDLYLISDPIIENTIEIYKFDSETNTLLKEKDFIDGFIDAATSYSGFEVIYYISEYDYVSQTNYINVYDDQFNFKRTIYEVESTDVLHFEEKEGIIYAKTDDTVILINGETMKTKTFENGVWIVNVLSDGLIRIDDEIFDLNLKLKYDFLFYDLDYTKSGSYLMLSDDYQNFFAVDNDYIGFITYMPREELYVMYPPVVRYLLLITSIFSIGFLMTKAHRKES